MVIRTSKFYWGVLVMYLYVRDIGISLLFSVKSLAKTGVPDMVSEEARISTKGILENT